MQNIQCRLCQKKRREQIMAKQQNVQTLTEADIEKITFIVTEAIKPTVELSLSLKQEVRGVNGDNGMAGTIKTLLPRREAYIVITTITILSGLLANFNSCQNTQGIKEIRQSQQQEQNSKQ